ncbi:MAG: Uma2 family endonuclease [Saprospiraceae bacterium]|nr:Uma2 family endonuclease [Saprospiraceae bacterium]MCF8249233.1 Uma2 family endonuclease [Saprospiraceae bacterium]MCF8280160.1 Uma2 family endonuclease [Bacteroidales bacterium]MCF8311362.1 Uma2 family endonuclease [Saprospiraceae bacterium]MCF8442983.1 Uma2 family endonuclease [Saprospiraceae bacterium]
MIAEAAEAARPFKSNKKRLTYDDYVRLTPPDSGNYELHDGQIIQMASPTPLHQDIAGELYSLLKDFEKANSLGKVYIAPLDTLFDKFNTFQPDVLFISKERMGIIGEKKIEAAPDLVVEVLSGSNTNKEMLHKKHTYEAFGVREYWLINLKKETVTQYILVEEEFESKRYTFDDTIDAVALPGFQFCLRNVLA